MINKLSTVGFDHIILQYCENQFFMLNLASKMACFEASEGFQKGFCIRIPTEKHDSVVIQEKKFRLANIDDTVIKIFLEGL